MISVLLVVQVLLSLAIITLIMLQRGKGAEAGAALGGGASGSVFGARGASNFLSRTTAILATAFFVSSLALAYLSSNQQESATVSNGSVINQSSEVPAADAAIPSDIPVPAPASDVPAAE